MAILIPADAPAREVQPANGRSFTLPELQGFVGGFIEAVRLDHDRWLIINEEGKREQLPLNLAATMVAVPVIQPGDQIVGAAVVCTTVEAGGTGAGEE